MGESTLDSVFNLISNKEIEQNLLKPSEQYRIAEVIKIYSDVIVYETLCARAYTQSNIQNDMAIILSTQLKLFDYVEAKFRLFLASRLVDYVMSDIKIKMLSLKLFLRNRRCFKIKRNVFICYKDCYIDEWIEKECCCFRLLKSQAR